MKPVRKKMNVRIDSSENICLAKYGKERLEEYDLCHIGQQKFRDFIEFLKVFPEFVEIPEIRIQKYWI
jgi:hypothetical protein